jgi:zinc protease
MPKPQPVINETLPNGLNIKLKEIHTVPLISHWVWYRVGSRDEVSGKTGLSHWVEHMQFKGTKLFPPSILDKSISREGGVWNAFTFMDWTTYFATLPAEKIDLIIDLEADRIQNSLFKPEEVEPERTVIISELEGNENDPSFKLNKAVQQAAFRRHPYRVETIGELKDLQSITRNDLYNHYRRYYVPNNAVLTMAGDFKASEMLKKLKKLYENIPAGELPPHPAQREDPLSKEARLEVHGPGETTFIQIAYRSPEANTDDFFTFTVLDSLMTGPNSLNMFGGGNISNKTSRLYRKLVNRRLAVGVGGGIQATVDPYLYGVSITLPPGGKPDQVIQAFDREIDKIQNQKVKQDEIDRAVKQAKALFAYGSENITNQAFWLGFSEMFATYSWFVNYVDRLRQVTPEDVLQLARKYLKRSQRVVGIYTPNAAKGGS